MSQSYGWVYDTAWALGVGLNNSLHYLNDSGLKDYTNNAYYLDAVMKGMHDAKFVGISVSAKIHEVNNLTLLITPTKQSLMYK